jgi:large subunit ribosomal protein L10
VDKVKKAEVVEQLKGVFGAAEVVIISHNNGLTVSQDAKLRRNMRKSSAGYRVVKNSLSKIAIKGTGFEQLDGLLNGPTSIAYAEDPVAVAKALVEFSKDHEKLEVLGGVMSGRFLEVSEIKALATLPSLDQLRGKIIGLLQAPASKIARVINEPGTKLVRVIKAKADKK